MHSAISSARNYDSPADRRVTNGSTSCSLFEWISFQASPFEKETM